MSVDCASWSWFSAGTSYHFPSVLYHYTLPGLLSPNRIQSLCVAPWRRWRRLAYQHVGRPLHDLYEAESLLMRSRERERLEEHYYAKWRRHNGSNVSAVFAGEQEKRGEICPFQLLYVSVIWRTQLRDNRNNRGMLISISLGKRLYPSFLFFRIRAKTGILVCIWT